jgi:hypothetical protein
VTGPWRVAGRRSGGGPESGQALVLMLGAVAAVMVGGLVLTAFGQALGSKGRLQRGADLAAVSAAGSMRADYGRLFEAAVFENGRPTRVISASSATWPGRGRRPSKPAAPTTCACMRAT